VAFTPEPPDLGTQVTSPLYLFRIVPHARADVVLAVVAPDVEGELEPNDEAASLWEETSPVAEGVLAGDRVVGGVDGRVVCWGKVAVEALHDSGVEVGAERGSRIPLTLGDLISVQCRWNEEKVLVE
jgi:hypothetical protein